MNSNQQKALEALCGQELARVVKAKKDLETHTIPDWKTRPHTGCEREYQHLEEVEQDLLNVVKGDSIFVQTKDAESGYKGLDIHIPITEECAAEINQGLRTRIETLKSENEKLLDANYRLVDEVQELRRMVK